MWWKTQHEDLWCVRVTCCPLDVDVARQVKHFLTSMTVWEVYFCTYQWLLLRHFVLQEHELGALNSDSRTKLCWEPMPITLFFHLHEETKMFFMLNSTNFLIEQTVYIYESWEIYCLILASWTLYKPQRFCKMLLCFILDAPTLSCTHLQSQTFLKTTAIM